MAPDFTLQDAGGVSLKLSDYKGKVVLLDFWATWCHGCKTEIPWYIDFQTKYKNRGLQVLGVSMDDNWTPVRPFLAEHNVNYPVAVGDDEVAKLYKVQILPVTLLIDKKGRIADSHVGVVDRAAFEKEIQALLDE
jgi:cytochrome c biogenesis protein CcmG/thiol:disulfide interchange protein DsbE